MSKNTHLSVVQAMTVSLPGINYCPSDGFTTCIQDLSMNIQVVSFTFGGNALAVLELVSVFSEEWAENAGLGGTRGLCVIERIDETRDA